MSDSFITKKAIASALKELCRTKPFEKISIADITSVCHLNRQTFYYHFQDKYELLSWIYYYEEFAGIAEGISFSNWSERIGQLLMTMRQEKSFFMNTIGEREHTFQNYLLGITRTLFQEAIGRLDRIGALSADQKKFDAEFYAYGITGVILSWTENGMKTPPEELAAQLKRLARHSEKAAYIFHEEIEDSLAPEHVTFQKP